MMNEIKSKDVNSKIDTTQKSIYDPLWAFPFKLIWKIIKFPVRVAWRILEIFG